MNREIALSLFYAEQGYTSDGMKQYRVESPETRETWDRLAPLLTPEGEVLELAAEYGAVKERDGFLNGFRLAVQLLLGNAGGNAPPAEIWPGA